MTSISTRISFTRSTWNVSWKSRGELAVMLGEQDAVVMEVRPFSLHGVTYYDVAVRFSDQTVEQARLGPEGVPGGLHPGERVLATRVGSIVVSLRRP
jgi:hypothetical protein